MQFERLRKSHKKEIVIGAIAICIIGGALTFATTRAKYKLTQSIDLVKGTINYKPYDFKIMAMYKSDDGTNYTEIIDRMPSEGYTINESRSYCTLDNKTHDTNVVLKTINGEHIIKNLQKTDKCYLYFDKIKITSSSDIITKSKINIGSPDFSKTATTDEGIYAVADGMYGGTSYYYRGAVTNNYVKFADKCWRIIRINGDGSIRMIYDGTTCHANGESTTDSIAVTEQRYNSNDDRSEYAGWTYEETLQRPTNNVTATPSNAKAQTEEWFNTSITGTNLEKVANGKYCNDRDTESGYSWKSQQSSLFHYAGYTRINDGKPTLSCPNGDTYTLKVGLITSDEVMYAGGNKENNNSYYLYNGQDYWTMSPSDWPVSRAWVFIVSGNIGRLIDNSLCCGPGLRPVINLRSDVTFSTGEGTLDNPYVVS